MRPSPLLSAAAAASLLAAFAVPASAASAPLPAAGLASSSITLLDVAAGGRTVSAGTIALLSDALGEDAVARILATPLLVDGKAYGERTITPAQGPQTVSALDTGAVSPLLAGLVKVTSPSVTGEAENGEAGPSTRVGTDSFGGLSVLGLPIALDGTLDAGSLVHRTDGAAGDKTLEVTDLALPSVADLLAALGLDLSKLPTDVLVELLRELDLLTPVVTAADQALADATAAVQTEIDKAQGEVDRLTRELAAATTDLAGAESQLAAKEKELADATAALAPLKKAVTDAEAAEAAAQQAVTAAEGVVATANGVVATAASLLNTSVDVFVATFPNDSRVLDLKAAQATLTDAQAALTSATAVAAKAAQDLLAAESAVAVLAAAVTALEGTVATLQGVVDSLQRALDDAVALLRDVLKSVLDELAALLAAVTAVLDGTPLVSIDSLRVVTESTVVSAEGGGQSAEVVGGEVKGLRVLGTDVLDDVLGTTEVELLELTGGALGEVNGLVAELTATLSNVLSTVDAFPALKFPAPKVELLSKTAGTGIVDGFGTATTSVRALSVTLPAITLPQALALPSAADLPAFGSALPAIRTQAALLDAAGNLVSSPVTIALGTLAEQARFRPAAVGAPVTGPPTTGTPTTGTPTTGTPTTSSPVLTPVGASLPRTGASSALAVLGVALMTAAFAVRRRREALEG